MDAQNEANMCTERGGSTMFQTVMQWAGSVSASASCSDGNGNGAGDPASGGVTVALGASMVLSLYAFSALIFRWNCAEYLFARDVLALLLWTCVPVSMALALDTGVLVVENVHLASSLSLVTLCVSLVGLWWVRTRQILAPAPGKSIDMSGSVCVITGANSGIGVETARAMALRGCRVVMACRDLTTANAVAKDISSDPRVAAGAVSVVALDLGSFKSVRECAKAVRAEVDHIDVLINNAGYMSPVRRVSSDGIEASLQINWLSNVLFTLLLVPLLRKGTMKQRDARCRTASRVVCVNSSTTRHRKFTDLNLTDLAFETNYSMLFSYTCSKMAVALCMRKLQTILAAEDVIGGQGGTVAVDCLNPGVINTNITRHISTLVRVARLVISALDKTVVNGSHTTVHAASSAQVLHFSAGGSWFENCKSVPWPSCAVDDAAADRLWSFTEEVIGLTAAQAIALKA